MSPAASSEQSASTRSQSPLWTDLLPRVEVQIPGRRQIRGAGPSSLDGMGSALARAHSRLLVALESGSKIGDDAGPLIATEAVELVLSVARVWATFGTGGEDRRGALAAQLRRRLSSHEDAVLAGEVTYCVWSEQAEEPAGRIRQAIARLSRDASTSDDDLLSLRIAAVDFASLLVRLAANAAASGRAGEAPDKRSTALDTTLSAVTAELASHAQELERPVDDRADAVAISPPACGFAYRKRRCADSGQVRRIDRPTQPFLTGAETRGCGSRRTSSWRSRRSTRSSTRRPTISASEAFPQRSPRGLRT